MSNQSSAFWRQWGCAIVLSLAAIAALSAMGRAHAETVRASFYGAESGRFNADGSRFAPMGLTAAHRSLPFGTRLEVCFRACTTVTVRDRGPAAWTGRAIDLSRGAARAIGLEARGVADITYRILSVGEPAHGRRARTHRRTRRHAASSR